ncbi:histone deacetylase [Plasmodium vivax India VII]|uniref:Histone deacetylase, putative n=6 Tax=Plasmodium vivax TaxID=5855 RepID=A5KAZ4_PLAVS|nr:histone deacetylase, putative [Plasmodium vivax]KMZ79881.1 histone deacetylase [Plasmodium vivax India VII]KMZ86395.1 histone deacetylase [Plasmodium vivax Brazil I]KMZ92754.1 histone deacetylase [Plasmodium vivax Mauritania I]KNA02291.1 histone deacetylase [Plasmodium vivax North Korean]EDL43511.1 histone deacetylase, putative [Plasmodium vivax]|eukprot:XP_001613238.1 histone deacetylase [Plasmodium vivax Sal-1]
MKLSQNSIDLLIDKFLFKFEKKHSQSGEALHVCAKFAALQNELNRFSQLAFFGGEGNSKVVTKQKRYSSSLSKNPPYVFHPIYSSVPMKEKYHRFKIKKYEKIFSRLIEEGIYNADYAIPSCNISETIISLCSIHDEAFVEEIFSIVTRNEQVEKYELTLHPNLVCRFLIEINGTILSSLLAMKHFMCMHIGGGNHHSKRNRGDGFCIFNDVAIAVHFLLSHGLIDKAIILDVDVHQGDGTAEIFRNCANVKTISLHCRDNFPPVKAHSTIDVEFDSFTTDGDYLEAYKKVLDDIAAEQNCIIFYLAGVDISADDDLGFLSVSDVGIYQRDLMTYQMAHQRGIPVVTVLSGGYNECEGALAEKHLLTFR